MPIQQTTRATPREQLGVAFHEYTPEGMNFVATQILPEKPVAKKAAYLPVITRENMKRAETKHANGAAFNRVTLTSEDTDYACVDHGLEGQLTDEDRENYASDYDAEVETVQNVKTIMLIEREIRVATAIFNTTTWATGTAALYTDVSSAPWDAAASDVIGHVRAAKEIVRSNTGVIPDSMVIGQVTFNNLMANTAILGKFPGAVLITEDMIRQAIASILGIQNLIVGSGVYDGALEGQTFSGTDVWSDDYALIFKKQAGGTNVNPGLGRLLNWTGENGQLANGLETVVEYREEQTESDVYRVRDFSVEKIWDAYFGHLLKVDA